MKTWVEAGLSELNIEETAQHILGTNYDGGYVGDGHIGLLEFPSCGNPDNGNSDGGDGSTSEGGVDSLS